MHSCHAACDVGLDGANYVEGVAVSGVGVGEQRYRQHPGDSACRIRHFGHRQQADVAPSQQRTSDPEPRHVRGMESGLLDQTSRDTVVTTGEHRWIRRGDKSSETFGCHSNAAEACQERPPTTSVLCETSRRNARAG